MGSPKLANAALAWRPDAYSYLAKKLGVSRQQVRYVARGERESKRIEKALRMAVARRRFP